MSLPSSSVALQVFLPHRSSDLSFCVDDLVTFAHLMSVMLNFKLCHGKIFEAGRAGEHVCVCNI